MIYRGRNRSSRSNIKGPNSALTQFLQEEGISAETIRQRWLEQQQKSASASPAPGDGTANAAQADKVEDEREKSEALPSSDEEIILEKSSINLEKRMNLVQDDSDEEEYEDTSLTTISRSPSVVALDDELRKKRTREVLKTRQRKRKRAAKLLDRRTTKIATLQDMAIAKISESITSWEREKDQGENTVFAHLRDVLGGISIDNMNNLAKTLSKNRALDDKTLQLFLKTDLTDLAFHDCSKLSFEGYKTLAIFSPHLTKLSLQMCGQLNNESLLYIAEKLPNLTSLDLDGPFLINEDTWDTFFVEMKGRLKAFRISNTHRFNDKSLASLLVNCGEELVSLGLSRLDSISNYALLPQYLKNEHFHSLSLEYPFNEDDITDEVVINILGQVGKNLKTLVLDGCLELTDSMIINGMCAFLHDGNNCSLLETLSLAELDQITNDSLVYFFSEISLPHLVKCSLKRCLQVGDAAIIELMLNKGQQSLKELSLNSLKELTCEAFISLSCENLQSLDLGFVRCVDDKVIEEISSRNPNLELIDVFGDNLVTEKAKIKQRLVLIGRQSDSI
ncbi:UV-damaged DNA-binding protein RAD7 NDAI_0B01190 [Naumovozyma dairenensis CBS 421]|uniref:DNA repair protein RAD7 n=1 Tax=Naumovozyma dairenensis (strain ATCC 10597 / BCRC 20456 / CBS 421 / NBRC 0211 / NRRL Y-12639) TaxID=1071378 RepID=G0W5U2_NAUDC|nr:hypothetical protein NDAI_0B01190 [Naumovozyma dairenensis CBS 421]CCD23153.1 hypothetical protein NDAI_0B01190 [Naumovozyma dairenensis CBS 421]